ncbi:hypothetical protein BDQ12DRAFT_734413 [Crucibulum laeve]|uniref:Monooxygenase n=1 Tax=Crucibulum laeve TaxID=68775 RepID=A0A5C3M713_9AGAR|nr:hypothetical protein BDQ12DRAFT_734413 [Crucibulum laeve]
MNQVPHIAIIGAGFGGLAMAIALKTQLGFNNFTIYEKASDIGGTWRDNVYPGCSSDNPIHLYSLSTDLRPTWTNTHGYQPEIFAYMKSLVEKYSLQYNLSLNTKFLSAHWDSEKQLYHITTEDIVSGKKNTATAQIAISAVGILGMPKMPEIAGIDRFKGFLFHSSRWNTKLDFQGKRVAVIGNGASATQFIPEIVKLRETDVTQFCRSRIWYLPPDKFPVDIRGCKGTSIQEYYEFEGGPKAHLGTTIPGFPNFYMLSGPNTATGYSPVLLFEEIQVKYILQMVQPVLQSRVSSFEVTVKATEAYNHKMQGMMLHSAFLNCVSPYRIGGDGKITFVFPGSTAHFWWWLKRPIWGDYISVCSSSDSGADTDESASPSLVKVMAGFGVLAVAVAWVYKLL